jgi:hypothetical protein
LSFGLLSETAAAGSSSSTPVQRVQTTLQQTLAQSRDDIGFALRWVFGPVIWLMSTFSLAYLAWLITDYLQSVSATRRVIDLFNPFTAQSRARYWEGALTIELICIAAGTAMLCIVLIERQTFTVDRAMYLLRQSSQSLILSFAFFTFSLGAINALVVFVGITKVEPFQVSAMTLTALVLSGALALWDRRRSGHLRKV